MEKTLLEYIIFLAELLVFFAGIYYLGIAFFSFATPVLKYKGNKNHKFAVLVAAHNEEKVISGIIKSLKAQAYSRDMFDIFVIADNCTDKTAEIARASGVEVIERFDNTKKGKGFALEYAFDYIFSLDKGHEYAVIFDADNIVDKNFLYYINRKINTGARAVQGYLDSKNPYDSWLTLSYSLWYWINNRLSQLSRDNLGIGARLGGTGLAVDLDLIKEFGWGATCLAEDTEFTLKLMLSDIKVAWEHSAVVYDEKPVGMNTSWNQRTRWTQGIYDATGKYIGPMLKKAFKEKKLAPFHMVMNVFGDSLYPASFGIMLLIYALSEFGFDSVLCTFWTETLNLAILRCFCLINALVVLGALAADNKLTKKVIKNFFGFFVYLASWIPIGIVGMFKKNDGEWFHTPHSSDKNDI